jgi:hypothetical protein
MASKIQKACIVLKQKLRMMPEEWQLKKTLKKNHRENSP